MKVLYLGVSPFPLTSILRGTDCEVIEFSDKPEVDFLKTHLIDFAVSFRCPHIIRRPVIDHLEGRIINLHISLLPWNRGADPNLWSFLEDTPKGVTIHYLDQGLDTGDIIAQKEIFFDIGRETLKTTYERLDAEIIDLFRQQWPLIMEGKNARQKQQGMGSNHKLKDKEPFMQLLQDKGWSTPIADLIGKGVN